MIFSEFEPESVSIAPFLLIAKPTTPMNIATASEITTHIEATLLES